MSPNLSKICIVSGNSLYKCIQSILHFQWLSVNEYVINMFLQVMAVHYPHHIEAITENAPNTQNVDDATSHM